MVDMQEIAHVPTIASLSLRERNKLLTRLKRRSFKENRHVYRKGQPGTTLGFVLTGSVKVSYPDSNDRESIVALLGPGSYVGEIAMITKRPRSFDVITLTQITLAELTREDFIRHTQEYKGLSLALLVAVAGRLDDAAKRIIDLGEQRIPQRVMRVLTQLAVPRSIRGETMLVVSPRPSQQDLVGLIGASREAVAQALWSLEHSKHLVLDQTQIIIKSIPSM